MGHQKIPRSFNSIFKEISTVCETGLKDLKQRKLSKKDLKSEDYIGTTEEFGKIERELRVKK